MADVYKCTTCGGFDCSKDECIGTIEKNKIIESTTELDMYKDYLTNMSLEKIAKKYNVTRPLMYYTAKVNNWKKRREKLNERAYKAVEAGYKNQIVTLVKFIQHDYNLLMNRCINENREMTKDERQYMLSLIDRVTKEIRLTEGKPTEITDGKQVVRHEVVLPPQVTRFGVIPPATNVLEVNKSADSAVENNTIDEDIDEDI